MSKEKNKKTKDNSSYFRNIIFVELISAVLSTVFCINFAADISLLAFPLALIFTGLTVYFAFFKMLKNQDGNYCFKSLKFIQYLPFVHLLTFILRRAGKNGTPTWLDWVTVILWLVMFFGSFAAAKPLSDKKIKETTKNWKIPKEKYTKPAGALRVVYEVIDWVDALVQAVFIVLIFQIFIIQLYEIPSESMVPTFLKKDRVLVTKFDCGPKFPLTDVGLPDFRKYKKGDTVVLRNPHYSMDRKSEVKSVTSQLVYMLTFMSVNLNKDENGQQKADPLVKRIAALPGEQIVMQDGILYYRTKNSSAFQPSVMDGQYAVWNLSEKKSQLGNSVETYPLSNSDYETMINLEELRRNYDLKSAENTIKQNVEIISALISDDSFDSDFKIPSNDIRNLFSNIYVMANDILTKNGGFQWFNDFSSSWIASVGAERDMYAEANYRLNVMTKVAFSNLIKECAVALKNNSLSSVSESEIFSENAKLAEKLIWYIQGQLDQRNMPLFPSNDSNGNPQYIPENCYFMMGDNRFNSLDLRHSYDYMPKALTSSDSLSVEYYSNMLPQYINKKYVIGKAVFRFWPMNRISRVR